ncbi:MAG: YmdB family metallophosphoesterase [Candidatus Sungbacteria bacterium]|uniref:YmdB family metallophosphoesterase n=1 Tax=Candidatus Sungiibacteriota bacterium TaxID=2750080 RepID=A0A9D6LR84_9BACT|nr:YmdB family metallophosphoesterase [Candidatus Sungbacteria bacterium]
MKLLIFGDIFGRPGREAIKYIAPKWKEEYSADLIMANGENLSHGKGISEITVREMLDAGVDVITGGNHSLEGKNAGELLDDPKLPLTRPINFIASHPGRGLLRLVKKGQEILIINAIAQTHMRTHYDSPYAAIEKVLTENSENQKTKIIIVDWHADTTSEKMAMGWWLNGKVSCVYGTHTHIATADERILSYGTACISDIGMTGPHNSIIGEAIDPRLGILVRQEQVKPDIAEAPPYEVNAILVTIDETTGKSTEIIRLRQILNQPILQT